MVKMEGATPKKVQHLIISQDLLSRRRGEISGDELELKIFVETVLEELKIVGFGKD